MADDSKPPDSTEPEELDDNTRLLVSQYHFARFLENAPLKKPVENCLPPRNPTRSNLVFPPLNLHCISCQREQTFKFEKIVYPPDYGSDEITLLQRTFLVIYSCQAHQQRVRGSRTFHSYVWFLLRFHENATVEKMGQYPRHNTSIDARLLTLLGDQRLYYRRGRECEDEGFGLGAAAYYRRVVENIIDTLLDELQDLIPEQDRSAYLSALDGVKGNHRAVEKINAVSDLMPQSLWLKGQNPLKLLHSVLSEDLHNRVEEDILALSEDTRTLLDFLLVEISEKRNRAVATARALERLLKRTEGQK